MLASKFVLAAALSVALVFAQSEDAANDSGFQQSLKSLGESLTEVQRQELKAIVSNPDASKQQVIDSIQRYFKNIGGDAEAKFNTLSEQFKANLVAIQQKVEAMIPTMDEEAKQMLTKVGEIHKNMSISFGEERKQLKALFDAASPELKAKIQASGIIDDVQDFQQKFASVN